MHNPRKIARNSRVVKGFTSLIGYYHKVCGKVIPETDFTCYRDFYIFVCLVCQIYARYMQVCSSFCPTHSGAGTFYLYDKIFQYFYFLIKLAYFLTTY